MRKYFWWILFAIASCHDSSKIDPNAALDPDLSFIDTNLPASRYNDIVFFNDTIGVIVGNDGQVLKTSDFGKTWKKTAAFPGFRMTKVAFLNEMIGFVIGEGDGTGIILKTDDGGDNWKTFDSGNFTPNDLHFADDRNGYILINTDYILKTTDGGAHWSKLPFASGIRGSSICFIDSLNGFVGGVDGKYYSTDNGAVSWQSHTALFSGGINDVFLFENLVFLASSQEFAIVDMDKKLIVQHDLPVYTTRICAINEDIILAAGYQYPTNGVHSNAAINVSSNDGISWKSKTFGGSIATEFTAITRVRADVVMIIGFGLGRSVIGILKI